MKKLIAIFALVFSVCVLNLKAQPGAQYIDGLILEITFYDGNECAFIDINGDMIWDKRVNIRAIADDYKLGTCHCFKVGETISYGLQRGLQQKQINMYRNSGENPANYGYGYGAGYYGTGYYGGGYYGPGYYGGNSAGISMTVGGLTVGGSTTSYGGQRRISGGVNVNSGNVHINAGGSTVVRRTQPQSQQVYQNQQVYSQPQQQVYSQQNQQQNNNSTRVVDVPVDQISNYLGL